ncbi:MAG TPA: hypothetical protein VGC54_06645, partial [Planctomycetota bacterium]
MSRFLLILTAFALFAGSLVAQSQLPVYKATNPKFAGVYRMDTGLDPSAAAARSGPDVIFNNTIASGYYSVPGAFQEWIDEGGLYDRDSLKLEDQINGFQFIYCTSEFDPNGIGGTYIATFYDDNIWCAGPSTWPNAVCAYGLAGLPLSPDGNLGCWIVTVDLMGGFECPPNLNTSFPTEGVPDINGAPRYFSWGGTWDVNNTGPWIMRGGYRRDNSFTWFDTNTGTLAGCFWFGGFPFANFAMKIWGPPAGCKAYDSKNFPGQNSLQLMSDGPMRSGAQRTFTIPGADPALNYWLIASRAPGEIKLPSGCVILIDPNQILPPTPLPMPGGTRTVVLPNNAPTQFYVQAVCGTALTVQ